MRSLALPFAALLAASCTLAADSPESDPRLADEQGAGCQFGSVPTYAGDACWKTYQGGCLVRGAGGECYTECIDEGEFIRTTDAGGRVYIYIAHFSAAVDGTGPQNACDAAWAREELNRVEGVITDDNPYALVDCQILDAASAPLLFGSSISLRVSFVDDPAQSTPFGGSSQYLPGSEMGVASCAGLEIEEVEGRGTCLVRGPEGECQLGGCHRSSDVAVFDVAQATLQEGTLTRFPGSTCEEALERFPMLSPFSCLTESGSTVATCSKSATECSDGMVSLEEEDFRQIYGATCNELKTWVDEEGRAKGPDDVIESGAAHDDNTTSWHGQSESGVPIALNPMPAASPSVNAWELSDGQDVWLSAWDAWESGACSYLPAFPMVMAKMQVIENDAGTWLSFSPARNTPTLESMFDFVPSVDRFRPMLVVDNFPDMRGHSVYDYDSSDDLQDLRLSYQMRAGGGDQAQVLTTSITVGRDSCSDVEILIEPP